MTKHAKPPQQSYLERLEFNPVLLTGWVARYLQNFRIVLLLILTIVMLGTFSYLNLPKRLNPEIKIPIVSVVTVMPGASPEDVESLVTIPLENELKSAKGLSEIVSVSQNNISVITLQYVSTVEADKAKDEAQTLVDGVTDLPDDAKVPKVAALDFEDQPIWSPEVDSGANTRALIPAHAA